MTTEKISVLDILCHNENIRFHDVVLNTYLPRSSNAIITLVPLISTSPVVTGAGKKASVIGVEDFDERSAATDQRVIALVMSSEDATKSHCDLTSRVQVIVRI